MRSVIGSGVGRCRQCGLEERSTNPAAPSAAKRSTHLRTVLALTPRAVATALATWPSTRTRRTNSARLCGVSRAFLWMFIRSPLDAEASQPQLPRPGPEGQPNETSQLEHAGAVLAAWPRPRCRLHAARHH